MSLPKKKGLDIVMSGRPELGKYSIFHLQALALFFPLNGRWLTLLVRVIGWRLPLALQRQKFCGALYQKLFRDSRF